jgi:hypothetical protein
VARLQQIKSRLFVNEGSFEEALDAALVNLRFGEMILSSQSSYIHKLIGLEIFQRGLNTIGEVLSQMGTSRPDNFSEISDLLNQMSILGTGSAYKIDYQGIAAGFELMADGGQKPDAVLGHYSPETDNTIAVVEIKDANTSLDKPQRREGNLSPIQQGFKYKPQYKNCSFVIATNFFEIRIFKDNQLDFEQFTLESLVDPKDNYYNFRKFYYLLCPDNFITKKGDTPTGNLLSEIRIEQEEITKKFYKEYKKLRRELILDIAENNKKASKRKNFYELTVQKAQKIVDRLVLIHFFEDLGLLPDNKLKEVVEY